MKRTLVVNLRNSSYDVYIGRPGKFGNPYSVQTYGRLGCIEKYRQFFKKKILQDSIFRDDILELRGKRLGCYCAPLTCHGNVIADYLNRLPE